MGETVIAPDGLIAELVNSQSKDKHAALESYVNICMGVRRRFKRSQATFLDLFSGTGLALIKGSDEWIDGSSIVASKAASRSGEAFSQIFIADSDDEKRGALAQRLGEKRVSAKELEGDAVTAANTFVDSVNPDGFHFAFVDPYALGDLDIRIFQTLLRLKRMDILVHFSLMDFRRNFGIELEKAHSRLDKVAPNWKDNVSSSNVHGRAQFYEYWRSLIAKEHAELSPTFKIIYGPDGQELYGLLLVARHDLAHKFWNFISKPNQFEMF